jgi:hypothetical protein
MEKEEDIHDELKHLAPGFPAKKSIDPPQGYFESFPDQLLNRWRKEQSHPKLRWITWRRVIGIAAVLTGLCIGGWWFFSSPSTDQLNTITAVEAYQYIHDNIDEFEPLIESGDVQSEDNQIDVPKEDVDEYLMEEMHGSNPEDLF